jgi:hypothetical protein
VFSPRTTWPSRKCWPITGSLWPLEQRHESRRVGPVCGGEIAPDGLLQGTRLHTVKGSKIVIQHDPLPADQENPAFSLHGERVELHVAADADWQFVEGKDASPVSGNRDCIAQRAVASSFPSPRCGGEGGRVGSGQPLSGNGKPPTPRYTTRRGKAPILPKSLMFSLLSTATTVARVRLRSGCFGRVPSVARAPCWRGYGVSPMGIAAHGRHTVERPC